MPEPADSLIGRASSLEPLERPLDGRAVEVEGLAQLGQGRLGRRPAGGGGDPDDPG